jgi:4'-phosphopantetheinyl transferase
MNDDEMNDDEMNDDEMNDSERDDWPTAPRAAHLAQNEAHIYRVSLDQPEERMGALTALLSANEGTRARRFHFERDRRRFVVGRASLRLLLARYLSIPPQRITFAYGEQGKPALAQAHYSKPSGEPLRFNLAHSDQLALFAITRTGRIGIDIERIKPLDDGEIGQMAERYFAAEEHEVLRGLLPPARNEAFYTYWTRKEAYIKALGSGLSAPLDSFAVSVAPDEPAQLLRIDESAEAAAHWVLYPLSPGAGYVATLAADEPPLRLRCWSWSPEG